MNHLGATMTVRGKVVRKYVADGEHLLDLDVWIETDQYGVTAPASATVMLPRASPTFTGHPHLNGLGEQ
jgi:hypothetical protein